MVDIAWHARKARGRLEGAYGLTRSAEERRRFRRRVFFDQASRFANEIGSVDRFGNRVILNTRDPWVSRDTFAGGTYEGANLENVVRILAERGLRPELVLDIGANIGTSTLELAAVFPGADLVAVEPEAGNYRLLTMNVASNALQQRVRTINAAVGEVEGTAVLAVDPSHPGGHTIGGEGGVAVEVPVLRLDQIADGSVSTFIWMDVQGYEGHAMRSLGGLAKHPAMLEFWPRHLKAAGGYTWLVETVSRYSTVLQVTTDVVEVTDLEALTSELETDDSYTDLLLLP
jgi:FkbM family methyltransferase